MNLRTFKSIVDAARERGLTSFKITAPDGEILEATFAPAPAGETVVEEPSEAIPEGMQEVFFDPMEFKKAMSGFSFNAEKK